jgi:osmoprotectant transport system ATP-binding protein
VTHDIDEAIKLGDRIAIMNQGRLEQYDTPVAILEKPASDLVVELLGPDRGLKRLAVTRIDPAILEHPPDIQADVSIPADRTLFDAFSEMLIHHAASIAVVDGDRILGVLTPTSFVAAIRRVPAEMEGART